MSRVRIFSQCNRILNASGLRLRCNSRHRISKALSSTAATRNTTIVDEKSPGSRKVKVLYDGDCPLCAQEMKVVRYLNKDKDILDLVDITKPGYNPAEHNNITYEEAMAEFHVIDQDNKIHKRVPATHVLYSRLGHGWSTFYTEWPILAPLFDKAYGWFARNRLRWTKREGPVENQSK